MSPGFFCRRVPTAANSGFGGVRLTPYGREAMDALREASPRAERVSVEQLAALYGKLNADRPRAAFDLPPAGVPRNRCLPLETLSALIDNEGWRHGYT